MSCCWSNVANCLILVLIAFSQRPLMLLWDRPFITLRTGHLHLGVKRNLSHWSRLKVWLWTMPLEGRSNVYQCFSLPAWYLHLCFMLRNYFRPQKYRNCLNSKHRRQLYLCGKDPVIPPLYFNPILASSYPLFPTFSSYPLPCLHFG